MEGTEEMSSSSSESNSCCSNLISLQEIDECKYKFIWPFSLQDWPQLTSPGTDFCFSKLYSFITYYIIKYNITHPLLSLLRAPLKLLQIRVSHPFHLVRSMPTIYSLVDGHKIYLVFCDWVTNNSSLSFLRPCLNFPGTHSHAKIVLTEGRLGHLWG